MNWYDFCPLFSPFENIILLIVNISVADDAFINEMFLLL